MDKEIQVIILIGQSNAEGESHFEYLLDHINKEKYQEYLNGYNNVKIAYLNSLGDNSSYDQFVDVKLGQGNDKSVFGPEVGIAEIVNKKNYKKPIFIIKYTFGGTALRDVWMSPRSGWAGVLYRGMVNYVNDKMTALKNMGCQPVLKAICWMQGESDSDKDSYYQYEELEYNFILDIKDEFRCYEDEKGFVFVNGLISDSPAWIHYKEINLAKINNASKLDDVYIVDTIKEGLSYSKEPYGMVDNYHYDSTSMIKLGHLFADVLVSYALED